MKLLSFHILKNFTNLVDFCCSSFFSGDCLSERFYIEIIQCRTHAVDTKQIYWYQQGISAILLRLSRSPKIMTSAVSYNRCVVLQNILLFLNIKSQHCEERTRRASGAKRKKAWVCGVAHSQSIFSSPLTGVKMPTSASLIRYPLLSSKDHFNIILHLSNTNFLHNYYFGAEILRLFFGRRKNGSKVMPRPFVPQSRQRIPPYRHTARYHNPILQQLGIVRISFVVSFDVLT